MSLLFGEDLEVYNIMVSFFFSWVMAEHMIISRSIISNDPRLPNAIATGFVVIASFALLAVLMTQMGLESSGVATALRG